MHKPCRGWENKLAMSSQCHANVVCITLAHGILSSLKSWHWEMMAFPTSPLTTFTFFIVDCAKLHENSLTILRFLLRVLNRVRVNSILKYTKKHYRLSSRLWLRTKLILCVLERSKIILYTHWGRCSDFIHQFSVTTYRTGRWLECFNHVFM